MVKLLFLITNELCLTILKCSLKVWNLFCTFRFKATSTLKPTVRGSAWFTEGSQSDYGRKTVLKFAVNAKQISTPLNGWINSTREQAHRSGGQEEGCGGEKRRNTGTGKAVPSKRQLRFVCFQLICLKLHLALRLGRNWEVACRSVECYK